MEHGVLVLYNLYIEYIVYILSLSLKQNSASWGEVYKYILLYICMCICILDVGAFSHDTGGPGNVNKTLLLCAQTHTHSYETLFSPND